jgi:hydroxyacylglutathione hydrolase
MIGLDRVTGFFGADEALWAAWRAGGGTIGNAPSISMQQLAERLSSGQVTVIDVRGQSEWDAGHLPGEAVVNIPLGYLTDRIGEVPTTGSVVVLCQSGSRSAIAASLLRAQGRANVVTFEGGFSAWQQAGYPIEAESPVAG